MQNQRHRAHPPTNRSRMVGCHSGCHSGCHKPHSDGFAHRPGVPCMILDCAALRRTHPPIRTRPHPSSVERRRRGKWLQTAPQEQQRPGSARATNTSALQSQYARRAGDCQACTAQPGRRCPVRPKCKEWPIIYLHLLNSRTEQRHASHARTHLQLRPAFGCCTFGPGGGCRGAGASSGAAAATSFVSSSFRVVTAADVTGSVGVIGGASIDHWSVAVA